MRGRALPYQGVIVLTKFVLNSVTMCPSGLHPSLQLVHVISTGQDGPTLVEPGLKFWGLILGKSCPVHNLFFLQNVHSSKAYFFLLLLCSKSLLYVFFFPLLMPAFFLHLSAGTAQLPGLDCRYLGRGRLKQLKKQIICPLFCPSSGQWHTRDSTQETVLMTLSKLWWGFFVCVFLANYGICYILIRNLLLPWAEPPSGRYRRKVFQKQSDGETWLRSCAWQHGNWYCLLELGGLTKTL